MVIAQVESDGRLTVLDRAKEMVRLGRRTLTSGRLTTDAMNAGVHTLTAFRTLAERQGVERFKVVATSAVREASNGGDFVQRVKDEVGLRLRVIPGREEARLIALGVRHAVDLRGAPTLIVDAGGGSVELIVIDDDRVVALHSLKLGVARLSEQYLDTDPPSAKDIAALDAHLATQLEPVLSGITKRHIRRVVGTSGTLLNLIAMAGHAGGAAPNGHLNNFAVSAEQITRLRRLLVKADREERLRIEGLDTKRADLIVAGACLADHILTRLEATEMVACTWALREGVLLDFIAKHGAGIAETERFADPRRRSVARFARHLGHADEHPQRVARLALQLFDQLNDRLELPEPTREWLEFAALLHDIGHHIGHKDHQHHSYYLITSGELLGFRRAELEIIGLTARYHRKSLPKDSDLQLQALAKSERRTVRALSALLRLADAFDRSHYGVVRAVSAVRRGERLTLLLDTVGEDAELELWEARRRARLLEEILESTIDFQVTEDHAAHADRSASVSR